MNLTWIFPLALGASLLAACSETETTPAGTPTSPALAAVATTVIQPTSTAAPTLTPTFTATPIPTAALGPTPTRTPTVTPTPIPTATVVPAPPPPTPTLTPMPIPTATPTPTATPEPLRCGDSGLPEEIVSGPDGPDGPGGHDRDSVFSAFEVHPADPDILFLGTERNGFVKSVDGGRTWVRLRQGLKTDGTGYAEVWDIAISPSDPQTMVAATLGSPGPITGPHADSGIYWSTDGGQSWTQMNCGFPSSRVMSVAFDPMDSSVAIAGLGGGFPSYPGDSNYYPGGVFRTTDGAQTWTRISVGGAEEKNSFGVMGTTRSEPWTLMTFGINGADMSENLGYLRSTDGGRSWTSFAAQHREREISSFTVSADGQVIYAHEPDTYRAWISPDAGATWSQSAIHQVNGPIAVSPADPNLVIFASQSQIRRSTDAMATVQTITTAPQPPGHFRQAPFQQIVFAPSDPRIVYAVTEGYLVYRSENSGATFELMANVRAEVLNVQP